MNASLSSSDSSSSSEEGVLHDILGADSSALSKQSQSTGLPETEQIVTRQRKRGSFVVATKAATPKPKKRSHGIFEKRLYAFPSEASSAISSESSSRQSIVMSDAQTERKTDLEKAVLNDCVKNHFLLACNQSQENEDEEDLMVGALVSRFEKVILRKNEILFGEGDPADFLYVLYRGEVLLRSQAEKETKSGESNNEEDAVTQDEVTYKIFGELELMTNSPFYMATAKAEDSCVLFRLGAADFQSYFLPQQYQLKSARSSRRLSVIQLEEEERLLGLLKKALPRELASYFFEEHDHEDRQKHNELWKDLLSERKVRNFRKGDVLIHKSKPVNALVLIVDGVVRATDNTAGGTTFEDLWIGEGKSRISFGWQSVLKTITTTTSAEETKNSNRKYMTGTIRAETDGRAIVISKKAFQRVFSHLLQSDGRSLLLDIAELRMRRWKRTQLQQIMVFKDSGLDGTQISGLLDLMHHCEYGLNETIIKHGQRVDAAMYFVREGSVRLELNRGKDVRTVERGGYFGEKNMLLDQNKSDSEKCYQQRNLITAIATSATTKVDILYLEECSKVVNTSTLGLGLNSAVNSIDDSVQWKDLRRHKLIGTGSFGQVWLASTEKTVDENEGPKRRFFALKVQAKYSIVTSGNGNADRLIGERNVMSALNSPFVMRLFNAFQDEYRLYMVTSFLPGGELESILPKNGFPESSARFYAASILEGLAYMHRKHILHRDVKPENVLLNAKGYPVLIDLGFAKYVPEKTYTFCGSPLFMAPEIILYKGQTKGVDYWSWAVLVYRLVTAKYPFYQNGMDEIALYKRICKGSFEVHGEMSVEFRMLMIAMLYPDPSQRLGSRANGWRDIIDAPWFSNPSFSADLPKLRKQTLPAPWVPPSGKKIDPGSVIHQSSNDFDDLFDDAVCGRIPDMQQRIFDPFGSMVDSPIGDLQA